MEQTSTPNREQAPTSGRETQKSEDAEVVGVPLSLSRAARYVSAVFSPLLIPTYAVAMAMWITPLQALPERNRMIATLGVFVITGIIPSAFLKSHLSRAASLIDQAAEFIGSAEMRVDGEIVILDGEVGDG